MKNNIYFIYWYKYFIDLDLLTINEVLFGSITNYLQIDNPMSGNGPYCEISFLKDLNIIQVKVNRQF